jgi:hypothetical protein
MNIANRSSHWFANYPVATPSAAGFFLPKPDAKLK